MQKRGLVIGMLVLLLSSSVSAVPSGFSLQSAGTARYTDFETDNIHILRLQNFTRAVVEEVGGLEKNLQDLSSKLDAIESQLDELKKSWNPHMMIPRMHLDREVKES